MDAEHEERAGVLQARRDCHDGSGVEHVACGGSAGITSTRTGAAQHESLCAEAGGSGMEHMVWVCRGDEDDDAATTARGTAVDAAWAGYVLEQVGG